MKKCVCLLAILGSGALAVAQSLGTGAYPFASFDNRGFDSINLGNLNTRFNVPIVSRSGRGMDFNYSIQYEGLIWTPVTSNGTTAWSPDPSWGFSGVLNGTTFSGYMTHKERPRACPRPPNWSHNVPAATDSVNFVYHDPFGGNHRFNYSITGACPLSDDEDQINGDGSTSDGSGYSFVNNYQVRTRNGSLITPGQSATGQDNTSMTDSNGNTINSNNASSFTDTLGITALTISGSSPRTFTYPIPSQNNSPSSATATISYTTYNVQTNFQCYGIVDPGAISASLVDRITLAGGSYYAFTYEPTPGVQGAVTARIASIKLPTGGTISYAYSGGCAGTGINGDGTVGALTRTTSDGTRSYPRSPISGGTSTTLTDEKGNQTVLNFVADSASGRYFETHQQVYQNTASGTPLLERTTCYNGANPNCDGQSLTLPVTEADVTESYNGNSQRLTKNAYDASGTLLTGSSLYNGTTLLAKVTNTYNSLGGILTSVVQDGVGNTAASTTYGYDASSPALVATSGMPQHSAAAGTRGNLTSVSRWLNTSNSYLTSSLAYDDTGKVVSSTDENGNQTTISYQCANALPNQVTNALSQTTTYGYDCDSTRIKSISDPNDTAASRTGTAYQYEASTGRLATITAADGGTTAYSYPNVNEVDTTVLATPSPSIVTKDISDSYGRAYQHVLSAVSTEISYDATGLPHCVTNPHTASPAGTDGSTCITAYDGLGRPLTLQQPDNTTLTWSYSGATVTSTDEAGKQWQRTSDSFGHLAKVVEPGNYATTYAYDGLGNIQTINQGGVAGSDTPRVRSFVYDSLSRLTNVCHPEGIAAGQLCSSNGPWSMTYNYYANGNLHQQTDARGVWAAYAYDAVNRLTDKYFNDGSPNQHFRYDQTGGWMGPQNNTVGRLSQAFTDRDMRYFGSGSAPSCNPQTSATANFNPANGNPAYCTWTDELYEYDAMGRVKRIGTAPPSEAGWAAHTTYVGYDLAGQMTALTYPSGRAVTQSWDGGAHLQNVGFDNWNGQHVGYTYASGFTYTPAGAQTEVTMGNGVYTHMPYNNRQQICQVWLSNWQGLSDTHYEYGDSSQWCANTPGNNGTISQILDMKNNNRSQGFSYDGLNRLAAFSNGNGTMQQTYSLDPFGNVNQSGTMNFQVGMNGKNQFNTAGFSYDQAGNMTSSNSGFGQTNYQFDASSRIFNVNNGAAFYTYDASGDRMRKDTADGFTEYQYLNGQPIAEKNADGTWSDYIYANGHKIARADSFDQRIHVHGTTTGNQLASWQIGVGHGYVIQSNDKLYLRQFDSNAYAGPNVVFTDNTQTYNALSDTAQQPITALHTQGQWVNRVVDLNPFVNKTVSVYQIVTDGSSPAGSYDVYYADMSIVSADGTVTPIYNRQPGSTFPNVYNTGQTSLDARVERSNYQGDSMQGYTTTTFYHGDHLGSSRMTTAGGGWPTTTDTFYPYGQEPGGTAGPNHYQYASLERDAETGLDHATFRQYSPTMGRWMSPDPYDGSMDLANPQSLNRYAYALNNPLNYTDPSGLTVTCVSYGNEPPRCTDDGNKTPTWVPSPGAGAPPWDVTEYGPRVCGGISGTSALCQPIPAGAYTPLATVTAATPAPNNAGHIAGCFAKGLVAGAATAVAVGAIAAVAAPVIGATAVTVGLGALAVAGTAALAGTSAVDIYNHNWAGLAYNAGTVVGGLAGGFAGGARTATAIDPNATPGYSSSSWKAQAYSPSQGSLGSWFGSGPTHASAGLANSGGGFLSSLLGAGCR